MAGTTLSVVPMLVGTPPDNPAEEERERADQCREACHKLRVTLSTPEQRELSDRLANAFDKQLRWWERRVRRVERQLHQLLASDLLNQDQRHACLETLFGIKGTARDGKVLSKFEGQLIADYRAMDSPGRTMLRTLCDRLVHTGDKKDGRDGATADPGNDPPGTETASRAEK